MNFRVPNLFVNIFLNAVLSRHLYQIAHFAFQSSSSPNGSRHDKSSEEVSSKL